MTYPVIFALKLQLISVWPRLSLPHAVVLEFGAPSQSPPPHMRMRRKRFMMIKIVISSVLGSSGQFNNLTGREQRLEARGGGPAGVWLFVGLCAWLGGCML